MTDCELNDGDIAMMMVSTAFVMLQTPAMGIAQAGMIRRKNALSMLMQTLSGLVFGSLLFFTFGFSLVFGKSHNGFIGDGSYVFLSNVSPFECIPEFSTTIPGLLYVSFQMMFAVMVPVIVTGAWAEKMTFKAFIIFVLIWPVFVYYPVAHWVWNPDGWLMRMGVIDFAGGITIHTSSGTAAFVAATYLQRREKLGERPQHHNMPLSILGGSIIWGGWYFFNGGSALKANQQATVALLNTHLAGCASAFVWTALAYVRDKHWHLSEIIGGAFAGLAAVTPGSGYVSPGSATIIGTLGGIASFYSVAFIKDRLRIDDVLDVTSLQGVPGVVGSLLVGLFADSSYQEGNPGVDGLFISGSWELLGHQAVALIVTIAWTAFFTNAIFYFMPHFFNADVTAHVDEVGLDVDQIGERAYDEALGLLLDFGMESMTTRLCEAVSKGDFLDVRRLLFAGADAEGQDYDGRAPLALAASEGHMKIMKYLCDQHGASFNVKDRYNHTPLDDAISNGHSACATWLLSRGAPRGSASGGGDEESGMAGSDGKYAQLYDVFSAAIAEYTTKLHHLLDMSPSYANIVDYDNRTPLHLACAEGKLASVQLLVTAGASLDCTDRWGLTPAQEAQRSGQHACAQFIANAQAGVHELLEQKESQHSTSYGSTSRIEEGHKVQIKLTRFPDSNGDTGIPTATAVSPLLSKNASTASVATIPAPAPLTSSAGVRALCTASRANDIEEIKRIFKKEPEVGGGTDYDMRSALHVASSEGHTLAVQELLKYPSVKENINSVDRWKRTALQDAIDFKHFAIAATLRDHGASVVDEALAFRLCMAASRGDLAYIKCQVALGVDVSVSDYGGRTALHLAAAELKVDIVEYLVNEIGVRTDPIDRFGQTPICDTTSSGIKRILNNAK